MLRTGLRKVSEKLDTDAELHRRFDFRYKCQISSNLPILLILVERLHLREGEVDSEQRECAAELVSVSGTIGPVTLCSETLL